MGTPLGQASAAFNLIGTIKSVFDRFGSTRLSIIGVEQEWIGGQLVHHYRMKVSKPRWTRSASKSSIKLNIPKNINLAELDLDLPEIQIGPITIPASKFDVTSQELIGGCLKNLHDGQEIPMSLWLPCSWEEALEFSESSEGDLKTYRISNHNDFPVKSCDIERPVLLTDKIREIKIIRQGVVISQQLIRLSKTFSVDFEAGKIQTYFPAGISNSDDGWFEKRGKTKVDSISARTESNCTLRFTFDLNAHDEIEIRLYLC
jgi:hypothetical protein